MGLPSYKLVWKSLGSTSGMTRWTKGTWLNVYIKKPQNKSILYNTFS